jgi:hypothetical protein
MTALSTLCAICSSITIGFHAFLKNFDNEEECPAHRGEQAEHDVAGSTSAPATLVTGDSPLTLPMGGRLLMTLRSQSVKLPVSEHSSPAHCENHEQREHNSCGYYDPDHIRPPSTNSLQLYS